MAMPAYYSWDPQARHSRPISVAHLGALVVVVRSNPAYVLCAFLLACRILRACLVTPVEIASSKPLGDLMTKASSQEA